MFDIDKFYIGQKIIIMILKGNYSNETSTELRNCYEEIKCFITKIHLVIDEVGSSDELTMGNV